MRKHNFINNTEIFTPHLLFLYHSIIKVIYRKKLLFIFVSFISFFIKALILTFCEGRLFKCKNAVVHFGFLLFVWFHFIIFVYKYIYIHFFFFFFLDLCNNFAPLSKSSSGLLLTAHHHWKQPGPDQLLLGGATQTHNRIFQNHLPHWAVACLPV